MKLCHVVPSLEEQYGGPSRSVYSLSQAFARAGEAIDLLATVPENRESMTNADGLRRRIFRRGWPGRLCPSPGMRRALESETYEVVHHHSLWLRTLHYVHRAAKRTRATFVLSPRGMMGAWAWKHHYARKQIARHLVHPGALEAVDGWHATSAEEEAEIRALGFKQPVCVAPNAVDAPTDVATAAAAAHWRALCPEIATHRVALFYSRFHTKKRVLELIDLWRTRAPAGWLLLLVGIPQQFTPDDLEAYVHKTPGPGRVAVFSGAAHPPPYAVAQLFLLPSHNENFGLVIAEALAHGVPALVTDTTPWREISRRTLGWCVPWTDYASALQAATSETPAALADRGARSREWVLSEFSWERSARTLTQFYIDLRRKAA